MEDPTHWNGSERRLEPDLRVIANELGHLKDSIRRVEKSITAIEDKLQEQCRNCEFPQIIKSLGEEVGQLRKELEFAKGMARGAKALAILLSTLVPLLISFIGWLIHR